MKKTMLFVIAVLVLLSRQQACADDALRKQAIGTMERAGKYYYENVATHGGYVYFYSLDLKHRWGEGMASQDQIWVQPPGTPTVGMAYLRAYEATGDQHYLDAATAAADALVYGQLRSGGWSNSVDLKGRKLGYRYSGGKKRRDGNSSLDDGQTQSAIKFIALADQALKFKNREIHNSAVIALDALLSAQFDNGGFPQVWTAPVSKQPVLKATYPDYDWRTEGRIKNYWDMYTINDNVCGYVADTLITAHQVYGDEKYKAVLARLGDFLILAQMPDPQPAWAQQYNYEMKPMWARKFEPAGISGDESQEVIETLLKIFVSTRNPKYLEPIPRALAYLKSSLLSDKTLARYYELKTNKPLYMVRNGKQYRLTYDDAKLPKHYGWKTPSRLDELENQYNALRMGQLKRESVTDLQAHVRRIIADLDDQGRWVSTYDGQLLVGQAKMPLGAKYLSSERFSQNLVTLATFLESGTGDRR